MNENLADEIRKTIESIKDMKIQASGINNYLSTLEGLLRADVQKKVDEAYQRGLQYGKDYYEQGCEGCKYEANRDPNAGICAMCSNSYKNRYERKDADDEIKVGDEVRDDDGETYVITCINNDGTFDALYPDGTAFSRADMSIIYELTGRHFEIDKILEAMKE